MGLIYKTCKQCVKAKNTSETHNKSKSRFTSRKISKLDTGKTKLLIIKKKKSGKNLLYIPIHRVFQDALAIPIYFKGFSEITQIFYCLFFFF